MREKYSVPYACRRNGIIINPVLQRERKSPFYPCRRHIIVTNLVLQREGKSPTLPVPEEHCCPKPHTSLRGKSTSPTCRRHGIVRNPVHLCGEVSTLAPRPGGTHRDESKKFTPILADLHLIHLHTKRPAGTQLLSVRNLALKYEVSDNNVPPALINPLINLPDFTMSKISVK